MNTRVTGAALREGESRHAFLLELDDALRPLADPIEIQSVASHLLGDVLGANRVAYFHIIGNDYVVERDYAQGATTLVGGYPLADFGSSVLHAYLAGRVLVVPDVAMETALSQTDRAGHASIQIGAFIGVPLIKNGRFVAGLTVHSRRPRAWTPQEVMLVQETAERTWAAVVQARAENALATSEAKYRTLFTNIDEAFCVGELLYDLQGRPHDRRLIEANPRYHELVGDIFAVGTTAREIAPEIDNFWFERYHEVLLTGDSMRFEHYLGKAERWFDVFLSRVGGPGSRTYAAVFHDITDRRRREANLALLSEVSRDLVALQGTRLTLQAVGSKICSHLQVAGVAFVNVDEPRDRASVSVESCGEGAASVAGEHALGSFLHAAAREALRGGREITCNDVTDDARMSAGIFAAPGIAAFICVPVVSAKMWRFTLCVLNASPREWRRDEIELLRELTSRIWARLEQARGEEALRASDERQRALFSQMVGGVAEADLAGRFVSVNRRYCEMVGYSTAELLEMSIQDICHADDLPQHGALVARVIGDREALEIENRYIRKDGSIMWVHHSLSAIADPWGQPQGIISVSVDITDRMLQEEQVRRGAALLDFIIDSSPVGFYIVNAELQITHMNADSQARAFRNVNPAVGRPLEEALGVLWEQPLVADIVARFRHTLHTGESYVAPHMEAERADLSMLESYDWQLQRITMPDGRHAVACYFYDTTRLREVEQQLREADRRKDEFLATLAHELRNPLAPIRNGLHLLKRLGNEAARFPEVHQMMERQLSHLVRLVDDLMEVSRITRGKVELRLERVALTSIVLGALETSRPLIDAGKHQLLVDLAPEPLLLMADPVRLTQVFTNLLNNAARYTEAGGSITVSSRRDGGEALISIEDNGLGIPIDMLQKIFDVFIQADPTRGRAQGGLGIGLTLVRAIVGLHKGTIEARSEGPGSGSEFLVRLPLATQ